LQSFSLKSLNVINSWRLKKKSAILYSQYTILTSLEKSSARPCIETSNKAGGESNTKTLPRDSLEIPPSPHNNKTEDTIDNTAVRRGTCRLDARSDSERKLKQTFAAGQLSSRDPRRLQISRRADALKETPPVSAPVIHRSNPS
jgi:hypothetical protein